MKSDHFTHLPQVNNLGDGNGLQFGEIIASKIKLQTKADKAGVLKPVQEQVMKYTQPSDKQQSQQPSPQQQQQDAQDSAAAQQRAAFIKQRKIADSKKATLG